MHRNNIALEDLAGRSRKLCSKQYVSELHDQGYTRDDAIEAVCQVFCVPYRAARLFVVSHPAWAADAPLKNRNGRSPSRFEVSVKDGLILLESAAMSATRGPFRPGEIVPRSGQSRETGRSGTRGDRGEG
jgi:hypothetical protein